MNSKEIQIQIITQNMKNNILSKNILNKYLKEINNFDILVEFTQEDNRKYINFPLYLFSHNIKNSEFKLINEISLLERPSEMNIGISIYSNGLNDIKIIDSGKIPIAASESGIKQIGFKFGYYTKGCVWTKIKIKSDKSDKIILFCSIHLPTDKYDGITNLKYILEKIEEIKKISNECDEVFLGGDFNFKIEKNCKDVFDKLLKDGILKDWNIYSK